MFPQMPKLSIIIPVYNVSSYLDECLESLSAQTFRDFEALCVDDGSTDGCDTILQKFAARDPRFKVFTQENKGVSAARNLALDNAAGEWIGFLDADDAVEPDWFERMMRHAVDGIDIVHAHSSYCLGKTKQLRDGNSRTFLMDGWSWLNLVRREALKSIRFNTGMRIKEDGIFFAELAMKTDRIAWVNEKGYNYRPREGSALNRYVRDEDCKAFYEALKTLNLSRGDFAQAAGFDLILWVKGRNWNEKYDSSKCPILEFWRREMRDGRFMFSDVRRWWRPGLRSWIKTGNLSLLKRTVDLRTEIDRSLFMRAVYRVARLWGR